MGLTMRIEFASILVGFAFAGCGAGMQTVCGVPYSDNGAGAVVSADDVSALPGASFKVIDARTWQLEQGGFSSAQDGACQFGVRSGHVYR